MCSNLSPPSPGNTGAVCANAQQREWLASVGGSLQLQLEQLLPALCKMTVELALNYSQSNFSLLRAKPLCEVFLLPLSSPYLPCDFVFRLWESRDVLTSVLPPLGECMCVCAVMSVCVCITVYMCVPKNVLRTIRRYSQSGHT